MNKVINLAKVEGKLAIRSIDGILFGIGMPLGVLLLTTMIAGNKQAGNTSYTFLDSSFSSLLVVGICATAFMGIPLTICDYRDKKILKHFFRDTRFTWTFNRNSGVSSYDNGDYFCRTRCIGSHRLS